MFVIVSTRMAKHQITESCVVIRANLLVFMHIVAVMRVVLDQLRVILFHTESHHSEKQSYVQTLKVNVTFDKLIILAFTTTDMVFLNLELEFMAFIIYRSRKHNF